MSAASCDGSSECKAERHLHGCFSDYGNCDHPSEHGRVAAPPKDGTLLGLDEPPAAWRHLYPFHGSLVYVPQLIAAIKRHEDCENWSTWENVLIALRAVEGDHVAQDALDTDPTWRLTPEGRFRDA